MKRLLLFSIAILFSLVSSTHALTAAERLMLVTGTQGSITPNLIPSNPGFESALTGTDNGNWYAFFYQGGGGAPGEGTTQERLLSSTMTGSYVGHVQAVSVVGYSCG